MAMYSLKQIKNNRNQMRFTIREIKMDINVVERNKSNVLEFLTEYVIFR